MRLAVVVISLFFTSVNCFSQKDTLQVNIFNFESTEGKCVIKLYDENFVFEPNKNSLKEIVVNITPFKTASYTFTELPYGTYAIITYHDKNNNSYLDRKKIGLPTEPVGNSNNNKGSPSFSKSKFELKDKTVISIRIRQLRR